MAKKEELPTAYKVVHSQVGPWPKGHVIEANDPILGDAENIERLKSLGAIVAVDDEPTGEPPVGPETRKPILQATTVVTPTQAASPIPVPAKPAAK